METTVEIRKAFYLCSCTREFFSDDIPAFCHCEGRGVAGFGRTRVSQFRAVRSVPSQQPARPKPIRAPR
jgi:hypothetical protein